MANDLLQLQELEAELVKNSQEKKGIDDQLTVSRKHTDQLEKELMQAKEEHSNLKDTNVQLVEQIHRMKGNDTVQVSRWLYCSLSCAIAK